MEIEYSFKQQQQQQQQQQTLFPHLEITVDWRKDE